MAVNQDAGIGLMVAGVVAEIVALVVNLLASDSVKKLTKNPDKLDNSQRGEISDVLKALIAKLPWIAVMGLVTIILGMVLLMDRWPWQSAP